MLQRLAILSIGFFLFGPVDSAFGQGLLGQKYFEIRGGIVAPQDQAVRELDDIGPLVGGLINHPVTENLDLNLGVEYSRLAGDFGNVDFAVNAFGFGGGMNYHFRPDERIDPFLGLSAGFVQFDSSFKSPEIERSDLQFEHQLALGGGIEFDVTEKVAVRPHASYAQIGDVDALSVGGGVNYWWSEEIFGGFVADYVTDVRDLSLRLRLGFSY